MTKRSRGTRRTQSHRPGTRAPLQRGPRAARPPSQLERAEEIASEIAEEQPVEQIDEPAAVVAADRRTRPRTAGLTARAATEYLYVAQDLRRIVVVAAALFAIMLVLWVLIVVARVIPI